MKAPKPARLTRIEQLGKPFVGCKYIPLPTGFRIEPVWKVRLMYVWERTDAHDEAPG